jgi:serine/threonine-protein kinase
MRLKHDEPGQKIGGRYQLQEVIGQGGMALVWRAVVDIRGQGRTVVAVKRLLPELNDSQAHVSMFEEEGRVGLKLRHPDIVDHLDFGREADGRLYLVMEWIEGLDLRKILAHYRKSGRSLGWPVVAHMGRKLLSALAAAHEYKEPDGRAVPIYHRDVSPQNVMVADGGAVKLSDFGLARAMDRGSMTNPNIIKGKLSYMAPEQVIGRPATVQTDIFSVGVILWEALVGRKLFRGESDMDLVMAVRNAVVPPLRGERPDTPEPLAKAIEQSLARDARKRFATAAEMGRAIEAALDFRNQRVAPTTVGRIVNEVREAKAAERAAEPVYAPLFEHGPPVPDDVGGDPIAAGESWPELVTVPPSSPVRPVMGAAVPAQATNPAEPHASMERSLIDEPDPDGSLTDDAGEEYTEGFDEPGTLPGEPVSGQLDSSWQASLHEGRGDGPEGRDQGEDEQDEHTLAEALDAARVAAELPGFSDDEDATVGGNDPPTLGGTGYPTMAGIVDRRPVPTPAAVPEVDDPDATPGPRRPVRR